MTQVIVKHSPQEAQTRAITELRQLATAHAQAQAQAALANSSSAPATPSGAPVDLGSDDDLAGVVKRSTEAAGDLRQQLKAQMEPTTNRPKCDAFQKKKKPDQSAALRTKAQDNEAATAQMDALGVSLPGK